MKEKPKDTDIRQRGFDFDISWGEILMGSIHPEDVRGLTEAIDKEGTLRAAPSAGKFIRNELERFPWAITAVKVQPDPGDMERMVRMIFRDAWPSFLYTLMTPDAEKDKARRNNYIMLLLANLSAVNWQIFFDQIKGTKRFYNLPETCKMLGRSRPTVINLIREGRIQAQKIGTEWAIPIESLEDYLDAAWHRPTPKPKKGKE